MNAIQLVQKFGQKLVGNKVNTPLRVLSRAE